MKQLFLGPVSHCTAMAMNLLPRCASVHHQSGACRSPFLTPSEGLATLNPPAWHQCHAKSGIGDVVRSYLHTTALSAELLRGPGGRSKFVSQEACKALVEAESVCKGFLPQVLRGSALVSKILDLLVESFRDAASGSNSFRALETPLLTFHNKAPLNMRKALQGRIVSAAGKLLSSPPETYPLGISLTALAAAVRGPGAEPTPPPDSCTMTKTCHVCKGMCRDGSRLKCSRSNQRADGKCLQTFAHRCWNVTGRDVGTVAKNTPMEQTL
ncbi:unnamed protein product [Durusdinium trenchii]|uniref:Uncharacterized protein n=2 Tax=Durusdinium trenchii TaxID=1381693 RepID=A0ABP0IUP4_9DINO